jgi:hypothetical protein
MCTCNEDIQGEWWYNSTHSQPLPWMGGKSSALRLGCFTPGKGPQYTVNMRHRIEGFYIYLFIHSSVCYKCSTWTSQSGLNNTKAMFHNKLNSVNKPITMINQLYKCKYYNRIKIIFLSYSTPPFTSNI